MRRDGQYSMILSIVINTSFQGLIALCIHGDKEQREREWILNGSSFNFIKSKNASFQSRKEKLHTQRELADKFGYGQNQDLQEDMDAWWGKFDITIKYQQEFCLRSRSYEKDDSE